MARDFPPSNERLDELRLIGDEEADVYVRDYFEFGTVRELMKALTERRELATDDVFHLSSEPDRVAEVDLTRILDSTAATMPDVTKQDIDVAQDLFSEYGPEILMILGCYSLPAAYAAEKGVQVLAVTEFLELQTERRLFETAQVIVDVMSEGLGVGEGGRQAAERTRLIHAAIRRLILEDDDFDSSDIGMPINQEDLAATLMTFSTLTLDGLDKMNMRVTPRQQEAYIDTWRQLGRLLGIKEELLPDNLAEAKKLTEVIKARQIRASEQGIALLDALTTILDQKTITGLPSVMMRLFLDKDVANAMKIEPNALRPIPNWVVHSLVRTAGYVDSWLLGVLGRRSMILRDVSLELLDSIMSWQDLKGSKPKFVLPESLDWYKDRTEQKRERLSRMVLDTALTGGPRKGSAVRKARKRKFVEREQRKAEASG